MAILNGIQAFNATTIGNNALGINTDNQITAVVDSSETGTLHAGDQVKLVSFSSGGQCIVKRPASATEKTFGMVTYITRTDSTDRSNGGYTAGDSLYIQTTILRDQIKTIQVSEAVTSHDIELAFNPATNTYKVAEAGEYVSFISLSTALAANDIITARLVDSYIKQ